MDKVLAAHAPAEKLWAVFFNNIKKGAFRFPIVSILFTEFNGFGNDLMILYKGDITSVKEKDKENGWTFLGVDNDEKEFHNNLVTAYIREKQIKPFDRLIDKTKVEYKWGEENGE